MGDFNLFGNWSPPEKSNPPQRQMQGNKGTEGGMGGMVDWLIETVAAPFNGGADERAQAEAEHRGFSEQRWTKAGSSEKPANSTFAAESYTPPTEARRWVQGQLEADHPAKGGGHSRPWTADSFGTRDVKGQPLHSTDEPREVAGGSIVKVTVSQATDLLDIGNPCDSSYVKVEYGYASFYTQVAPSAASPLWQETFQFRVNQHQHLSVKVYNRRPDRDSLLGYVMVPHTTLTANTGEQDLWLDLQRASGRESEYSSQTSRIQLLLSYLPESGKQAQQGLTGMAWDTMRSDDGLPPEHLALNDNQGKLKNSGNESFQWSQEGLGAGTLTPEIVTSANSTDSDGMIVVVTIQEADGLMESGLPCQSSYVKVEYGYVSFDTSLALNTSTPSWNEKFEFQSRQHQHLSVKVYHRKPERDSLFGYVMVPYAALKSGSSDQETWITLNRATKNYDSPQPSQDAARIKLIATTKSLAPEPLIPPSPPPRQAPPPRESELVSQLEAPQLPDTSPPPERSPPQGTDGSTKLENGRRLSEEETSTGAGSPLAGSQAKLPKRMQGRQLMEPISTPTSSAQYSPYSRQTVELEEDSVPESPQGAIPMPKPTVAIPQTQSEIQVSAVGSTSPQAVSSTAMQPTGNPIEASRPQIQAPPKPPRESLKPKSPPQSLGPGFLKSVVASGLGTDLAAKARRRGSDLSPRMPESWSRSPPIRPQVKAKAAQPGSVAQTEEEASQGVASNDKGNEELRGEEGRLPVQSTQSMGGEPESSVEGRVGGAEEGSKASGGEKQEVEEMPGSVQAPESLTEEHKSRNALASLSPKACNTDIHGTARTPGQVDSEDISDPGSKATRNRPSVLRKTSLGTKGPSEPQNPEFSPADLRKALKPVSRSLPKGNPGREVADGDEGWDKPQSKSVTNAIARFNSMSPRLDPKTPNFSVPQSSLQSRGPGSGAEGTGSSVSSTHGSPGESNARRPPLPPPGRSPPQGSHHPEGPNPRKSDHSGSQGQQESQGSRNPLPPPDNREARKQEYAAAQDFAEDLPSHAASPEMEQLSLAEVASPEKAPIPSAPSPLAPSSQAEDEPVRYKVPVKAASSNVPTLEPWSSLDFGRYTNASEADQSRDISSEHSDGRLTPEVAPRVGETSGSAKAGPKVLKVRRLSQTGQGSGQGSPHAGPARGKPSREPSPEGSRAGTSEMSMMTTESASTFPSHQFSPAGESPLLLFQDPSKLEMPSFSSNGNGELASQGGEDEAAALKQLSARLAARGNIKGAEKALRRAEELEAAGHLTSKTDPSSPKPRPLTSSQPDLPSALYAPDTLSRQAPSPKSQRPLVGTEPRNSPPLAPVAPEHFQHDQHQDSRSFGSHSQEPNRSGRQPHAPIPHASKPPAPIPQVPDPKARGALAALHPLSIQQPSPGEWHPSHPQAHQPLSVSPSLTPQHSGPPQSITLGSVQLPESQSYGSPPLATGAPFGSLQGVMPAPKPPERSPPVNPQVLPFSEPQQGGSKSAQTFVPLQPEVPDPSAAYKGEIFC